MDRIWKRTLLLLSLTLAPACATLHTLEAGRYEVVSLATLEKEGERLAPKLFGEGLIVKLDEGSEVPLSILVTTPLLSASSEGGTVRAMRDLHLFMSERGVMLSPDGTRFAPVDDRGAMRKLFGLKGGQFGIGFGVTREEGAKVTVRVQSR